MTSKSDLSNTHFATDQLTKKLQFANRDLQLRYLQNLLYQQYKYSQNNEVDKLIALFKKIDPLLHFLDNIEEEMDVTDVRRYKIYKHCTAYNKHILDYLQNKRDTIRQEFLQIHVDRELLRLRR